MDMSDFSSGAVIHIMTKVITAVLPKGVVIVLAVSKTISQLIDPFPDLLLYRLFWPFWWPNIYWIQWGKAWRSPYNSITKILRKN